MNNARGAREEPGGGTYDEQRHALELADREQRVQLGRGRREAVVVGRVDDVSGGSDAGDGACVSARGLRQKPGGGGGGDGHDRLHAPAVALPHVAKLGLAGDVLRTCKVGGSGGRGQRVLRQDECRQSARDARTHPDLEGDGALLDPPQLRVPSERAGCERENTRQREQAERQGGKEQESASASAVTAGPSTSRATADVRRRQLERAHDRDGGRRWGGRRTLNATVGTTSSENWPCESTLTNDVLPDACRLRCVRRSWARAEGGGGDEGQGGRQRGDGRREARGRASRTDPTIETSSSFAKKVARIQSASHEKRPEDELMAGRARGREGVYAGGVRQQGEGSGQAAAGRSEPGQASATEPAGRATYILALAPACVGPVVVHRAAQS